MAYSIFDDIQKRYYRVDARYNCRSGQIGLVIGWHMDASYQDVRLRFMDGEEDYFHLRDLTKVEEPSSN